MSNEEIISKVMNEIEEFYFGEGEESGEAIFDKFAVKHHELFEADFEAEGAENKLEFTQVYKEF